VTSEINYLGINENFPVAGQDNDTQVFRDNFSTIKRSLNSAQTEITDLQENTAKRNEENDFEQNVIFNAIFTRNTDQLADKGNINNRVNTIDFQDGPYQMITFDVSRNVAIDGASGPIKVDIDFLNFPADLGRVGKVTLELKTSGQEHELTFVASGGMVFKKNSTFPTNFIVNGLDDPILLEIWRHDTGYMFLNYLGQFS
jgi:hypothetical protein